MKQITTAVFSAREDAEKAINYIHNKLDIRSDNISYIYRDVTGKVKEVDVSDISSDTPAEGARKGAAIGGTLGAVAGIAALAGLIPVIGPIFAAGALTTALGLTGAIGTVAAGAVTGAAAVGLIGALVNIGIGKENAQQYADRVNAGDILVVVTDEKGAVVADAFTEKGATDVNTYAVTL